MVFITLTASLAMLSDRSPYTGVVIHQRLARDGGATLAHELGHHLGLYHTDVDTLRDTFDFNHWLDGDQRGEYRNLMNVGGGTMRISRDQKHVMMRNTGLTLYSR